MDKDVIKAAVAELLDERNRLDSNTHKADHEFIRSLRQKEEAKAQMYAALKVHLLKWGAISVLSFIGYAIYYYLTHLNQVPPQ